MSSRITLVGDGIENPANARALIDAARAFRTECLFRDRRHLAGTWQTERPRNERLLLVTADDIPRRFNPVVAFDNLPGAVDVYDFRLPRDSAPALIVGNERHGIAQDLQAMSNHRVRIPVLSPRLNCLNVAAAAAVGLYYLSRESGREIHHSVEPARRRPEVLFLGPVDHIEIGSSIRSAGAFGWGRVFVEDRSGAWFGSDRIRRSEGRAAARRARNPIHVVPLDRGDSPVFDRVSVVTTKMAGSPLSRASLARGARQLVVIPDESAVDVHLEDWRRFGRDVRFVRPELPVPEATYHLRFVATIALAEIARQVGRPKEEAPARRRGVTYEKALETIAGPPGEVVFLEDLVDY